MPKQQSSTDLALVEAQVPDYLREVPVLGVTAAADYSVIPRFKLVQAMTAVDVKEQFGEGSLIVSPDGILVASFDEKFTAVPIFFWPSWEQWRDANDTEGAPVINSTYDRTHPIAQKAQNKESWEEPYENNPKFRYRYCESLNFIVEVQSGPAAGIQAMLSFLRGTHKIGRKLCGYINRRGVSIFANCLEFHVRKETKPKPYYLLDFGIPKNPFVSQSDYKRLRDEFARAEAAYNARTLAVASSEDEQHD